jgi:hypothetical protein
MLSIVVLAYNNLPPVQSWFSDPPTIKVESNLVAYSSNFASCSIVIVSVDPTDEIKDLQVVLTLDRPAQESAPLRFTDTGKPNHYGLDWGVDESCHPRVPSVQYARNLTFELSSDGMQIRIRGHNLTKFDAGGIFAVIPVSMPPIAPRRISFKGEATYSVLGHDQPANLEWENQTVNTTQKIRPGSAEWERLIPESNWIDFRSGWFWVFLFGLVAQTITARLAWVPGSEKNVPQPPTLEKGVLQYVTSVVAAVFLVLSSSAAAQLLSRKPNIQVVPYQLPSKGMQKCVYWGFSIRSDRPVSELHLVTNFEQRIHGYALTDGSEFEGRTFQVTATTAPPCELQPLPTKPNSHLDVDLSSDSRQVIVYSGTFTPYDAGGVILSFYPFDKSAENPLITEWSGGAHYTDFLGHDLTAGIKIAPLLELK